MNSTLTYPLMPQNADVNVIKPSASFKKSVTRVTIAMLLFVVTYLLVLVAAVAIAIATGFAGVGLMYIYPSFITLAIGIGFILCGVLLLYFLVKFVFKRTKADNTVKVEITEQEQPELFAFIRRLTSEASAPFPRHIYLTPDVNAGVFYNSSFWSMFLPVKKNLNIGLGLVNCLNVSQFKAVMAHEFGHFAQRSMKFGSYIYNMNRVIYNMLYENEGYQNTINTIASVHSFVRLGIVVNIYLIKGIQGILRQVYMVINKQYMGLSREMEFHADAVAAYVAGSNQSVDCLRRSELSQLCYNDMMSLLEKLARDKKRPANVYPYHINAMRFFAAHQQLKLDAGGIPVIDKKLPVLNNTQIVIDNQWSSHPSQNEREARLVSIDLNTPTVDEPAWSLFRDTVALQNRVSDLLYINLEGYELADEVIVNQMQTDAAFANSFNSFYRGYYDDRYLTEFDTALALAEPVTEEARNENLFSDEHCNLPGRITGLQIDINTVDAISGADHIKTFDFKGVKYTRDETDSVKTILEKELAVAKLELDRLDKKIFVFFCHQSADCAGLVAGYQQLFECQQQATELLKRYEQMAEQMRPVYQTMKYDDIEQHMEQLYMHEIAFKDALKQLFDKDDHRKHLSAGQQAAVEKYLSKKYTYFDRPVYNEPALLILNDGLSAYFSLVNNHYIAMKRNLLNLQLQ